MKIEKLNQEINIGKPSGQGNVTVKILSFYFQKACIDFSIQARPLERYIPEVIFLFVLRDHKIIT